MKGKTSSRGKGGEPPPEKPKATVIEEADRADKYLPPAQPGRVELSKIYWHLAHRGGQGIMPTHAQDVALGICKSGISKRRYKSVRLLVVPEGDVPKWLSAIQKKIKRSPLLARFKAMSHAGPFYATLNCTHFVGAQRLILERGSKAQGPTRRSTIPAKGGRP